MPNIEPLQSRRVDGASSSGERADPRARVWEDRLWSSSLVPDGLRIRHLDGLRADAQRSTGAGADRAVRRSWASALDVLRSNPSPAVLRVALEGLVSRPAAGELLADLLDDARVAARRLYQRRTRHGADVVEGALRAMQRVTRAGAETAAGPTGPGLDAMEAALVMARFPGEPGVQAAAMAHINEVFRWNTGDHLFHTQFGQLIEGGAQGTGMTDPDDLHVGIERDEYLERIFDLRHIPRPDLAETPEIERVSERAVRLAARGDRNPSLAHLRRLAAVLPPDTWTEHGVAAAAFRGYEAAPGPQWRAFVDVLTERAGGNVAHLAARAGAAGVLGARCLGVGEGDVRLTAPDASGATVAEVASRVGNGAMLEFLAFASAMVAPGAGSSPLERVSWRAGRSHRRQARRRLGRAISEAAPVEVHADAAGLIAEFAGLEPGMRLRPDGTFEHALD